MSIEPIVEGKISFFVYVNSKTSRCQITKFVDSLEQDQQIKFSKRIQRWAAKGIPNNDEQFKHEQGKIFAYKQGQVRIYGFYKCKTEFVFTNGCLKKTDKADPNELSRAEECRLQWEKENEQ
ncbi:MAG: type II toxin-antitoxin system RelE/ParE family toxin [Candidatus Hinthialibacter antarcticus]|nr:type II toxin-antitoxin system RelE/ParE family toxin [Candidatus Hinthialibacter antarcticus]